MRAATGPLLLVALACALGSARVDAAAAADGRPLPVDSTAYRKTRALLPKSFRELHTEHFVVLSDDSRRWTKAHARRLERVYDEFHRYTERLGLEPGPLRHRLVSVLFSRRDDFHEFASRQDGVGASWSCGYYSLANKRTVVFNGVDEPDADEFTRLRTMATTIHETIHQLHYHTGLQNKRVQYPLWCGEGLATTFETDDARARFGPDHDYGARRERFERLLDDDRLLPLRTLVALDRMPDDRARTIFTVYNQSYALVAWLAENRPHALARYLEIMRDEPPGRPAPQRHLEIFESVFGDVERLERAWLRDEHRRSGRRPPGLAAAGNASALASNEVHR